jgi:hypothetical protein
MLNMSAVKITRLNSDSEVLKNCSYTFVYITTVLNLWLFSSDSNISSRPIVTAVVVVAAAVVVIEVVGSRHLR